MMNVEFQVPHKRVFDIYSSHSISVVVPVDFQAGKNKIA